MTPEPAVSLAAADALTLSVEPLGGRNRPARLVAWTVLGFVVLVSFVISMVTGLLIAELVGSKEIVIRRAPSGEEVARGITPPFRASRLLKVMERGLGTLTEVAFLELWGNANQWERQLWNRDLR